MSGCYGTHSLQVIYGWLFNQVDKVKLSIKIQKYKGIWLDDVWTEVNFKVTLVPKVPFRDGRATVNFTEQDYSFYWKKKR